MVFLLQQPTRNYLFTRARNYLFCVTFRRSCAVHFTNLPKFPTSWFPVFARIGIAMSFGSSGRSCLDTQLCFHHLFMVCTFQETPVTRPYYIADVITVIPFFHWCFLTSHLWHVITCTPVDLLNLTINLWFQDICVKCCLLLHETKWWVHAIFALITLLVNTKNSLCGPVQWFLSLVTERSIFDIPIQVLAMRVNLAICYVPLSRHWTKVLLSRA